MLKINKNPSSHEVRRFTAIWMAASACLGGLLYYRHHPAGARGVWTASLTVGFLGAFVPVLVRGFYNGWMTLTEGINFLITRILLLFIFWGVLTPLALLFKILGRDALGLKKLGAADTSYWKDHERISDVAYYKHLY